MAVLREHQASDVLLATDFRVPFDKNVAERYTNCSVSRLLARIASAPLSINPVSGHVRCLP